MITASHNPYIWNGFKYKPEYAGSASPEVLEALEKGIDDVLCGQDPVSVRPLADAQRAGLGARAVHPRRARHGSGPVGMAVPFRGLR